MRKIIVGAWGLFFRAGEKAPLMLTGDQDAAERCRDPHLSARGNLIDPTPAEAFEAFRARGDVHMATGIRAQVQFHDLRRKASSDG